MDGCDAYKYFDNIKLVHMSYISDEGINIGHIEELKQCDLNIIKVDFDYNNKDHPHYILFTPIIFWMNADKVEIYEYGEYQLETTLSQSTNYIFGELYRHLNKMCKYEQYAIECDKFLRLILDKRCAKKVNSNKVFLDNVVLKVSINRMYIDPFGTHAQVLLDFCLDETKNVS